MLVFCLSQFHIRNSTCINTGRYNEIQIYKNTDNDPMVIEISDRASNASLNGQLLCSSDEQVTAGGSRHSARTIFVAHIHRLTATSHTTSELIQDPDTALQLYTVGRTITGLRCHKIHGIFSERTRGYTADHLLIQLRNGGHLATSFVSGRVRTFQVQSHTAAFSWSPDKMMGENEDNLEMDSGAADETMDGTEFDDDEADDGSRSSGVLGRDFVKAQGSGSAQADAKEQKPSGWSRFTSGLKKSMDQLGSDVKDLTTKKGFSKFRQQVAESMGTANKTIDAELQSKIEVVKKGQVRRIFAMPFELLTFCPACETFRFRILG